MTFGRIGASLLLFSGIALAADIGGTITSTLIVTEDSVLVDDVSCTVENAPCIVLGSAGITLNLNGFTITGLADAETGCGGGGVATEIGIDVNGQNGAIIKGPGVVRQIRGFGVRLLNSKGGKVTGITASTNCFAGIFLNGSSGFDIDGNVSVRNGHMVNPCGGI